MFGTAAFCPVRDFDRCRLVMRRGRREAAAVCETPDSSCSPCRASSSVRIGHTASGRTLSRLPTTFNALILSCTLHVRHHPWAQPRHWSFSNFPDLTLGTETSAGSDWLDVAWAATVSHRLAFVGGPEKRRDRRVCVRKHSLMPGRATDWNGWVPGRRRGVGTGG